MEAEGPARKRTGAFDHTAFARTNTGKSQIVPLLSDVSSFAYRSMPSTSQLFTTIPKASIYQTRHSEVPMTASLFSPDKLQAYVYNELQHVNRSQLIKPLGSGPFPSVKGPLESSIPLSILVPPLIPSFQDKALPSTRRPASHILPSGKRNVHIRKRREERQAAADSQSLNLQGPLYPFHHTFRPMPGGRLPSSQSPYPSLATLDLQFASSLMPLSQGQQEAALVFEEARVHSEDIPRANPVVDPEALLASRPKQKGTEKKASMQTERPSQQTGAVEMKLGENGSKGVSQGVANPDSSHHASVVAKGTDTARVQGELWDPRATEDASVENGEGGGARQSGPAIGNQEGLVRAVPEGAQLMEKEGGGASGGDASKPKAGEGNAKPWKGTPANGVEDQGASEAEQVSEGKETQNKAPVPETEVSTPMVTAGSAPVSASMREQTPASILEAASEVSGVKRKQFDAPATDQPEAPAAAAEKKQRTETLITGVTEGAASQGRWKPCETCRKARKGGCGTENAVPRCELIKGNDGAPVRVFGRLESVSAEVRPWASHLSPEVRAQIIAGSGKLPLAGSAAVRALSSARIPYLYFGTSPGSEATPPEQAPKIDPAAYVCPTPQSYVSRLKPSPPAAPVPEPTPIPPIPKYDIPTPSKILSALGPPVSKQVSRTVTPSLAPPRAPSLAPSLAPPLAPGLALLPQVSQLLKGRVEKRPELRPKPPSRKSSNPATAIGRSLDARAVATPVAPYFPCAGQLTIPNLPIFRNPPTSSVGAQILAPRPNNSSMALLGPFLRAHEFARGSLPQGEASTDVNRIRGGGPQVRKRKESGAGASKQGSKRMKEKAETDGSDLRTEDARVVHGTVGAEENGVTADGGAEVREESEGRKVEGSGILDSAAVVVAGSGRYGLRSSARVRRSEEARVSGRLETVQMQSRGAPATAKTVEELESKAGEQGVPVREAVETSEQSKRGRKRAAGTEPATGAKAVYRHAAGGKNAKGATKRRKKGDREETPREDLGGGLEEDVDGPGKKKRRRTRERKRQGAIERADGSGTVAAAPAGRKIGVEKGQAGLRRAPLIVFAHGAGAGASSTFMQRWKELLKSATGAADVVTFDYPYLADGKKGAPPKAEKLIDFHTETIKQAQAKHPGCPLVLAGKSMGSRVSCMIGGQDDAGLDIAAVVCLGYPLKGMGKGPLREQTLLDLKCPVLFVQGSKDSMCPLDLLADVQARMSASNDIHVVEGGDHGLSVGSRTLKAQEVTGEEVEAAALEAITSFLRPLV